MCVCLVVCPELIEEMVREYHYQYSPIQDLRPESTGTKRSATRVELANEAASDKEENILDRLSSSLEIVIRYFNWDYYMKNIHSFCSIKQTTKFENL